MANAHHTLEHEDIAPLDAESAQAPDSPELRIRTMPVVNTVDAAAPLRWLALGWDDLLATRFRGTWYGATFAIMGWLVATFYATRWQLAMALLAGFLLMGPFVCTGIYELSRQRARGEAVDLPASMFNWQRNIGAISFFAAILTFFMVVWARVGVVVFALFTTSALPTMQSVLAEVFSLENPEFLITWMGVGFIFASISFAIGAVSVPLMLDRPIDTMIAMFTSVRTLLQNPAAMYVWAALIVLIIGASLALWIIPLIVPAPLIGHATWHAYRDLVGADTEAAATPR